MTIAPGVVRLFDSRRPATISGLVIAIGILAFKRMLRCGARPHIDIERLEAFLPALTHRNAASTIILKVRGARNEAPSFGVVPDRVLRRARSIFGHAVSYASPPCFVSVITSAAFRMSRFQRICGASCFATAIATTKPHKPSAAAHWSTLNNAQDNEAAEPPPRQVVCIFGYFQEHQNLTLAPAVTASISASIASLLL